MALGGVESMRDGRLWLMIVRMGRLSRMCKNPFFRLLSRVLNGWDYQGAAAGVKGDALDRLEGLLD